MRKPSAETLGARGSSPRHLRRRADLERLAEPVGWMNEREEPAWTLEFDFLRALRALPPEERLRIAADLAAPAERHRYLTRATWAH